MIFQVPVPMEMQKFLKEEIRTCGPFEVFFNGNVVDVRPTVPGNDNANDIIGAIFERALQRARKKYDDMIHARNEQEKARDNEYDRGR